MNQPLPSPSDGGPAARALAILKDRFGHAGFREGQEAAVISVLRGRSLLVVMPTGSGKSLLYQLPALLEEGLTLVVSPLIALMKDQVDDLARRGVPATFINSSVGLQEQEDRIRRCAAGEFRLLYVAPERFRSSAFLDMIRRVKVARMAVDEAHCISEWGHDFRPDYRRMKEFRGLIGRPPVTALTATATPRVQQDIVESLGLPAAEVDVHVHGFDRPNLALRVADAPNEGAKMKFVLDFLRKERGSGIIYTGTRQAAEDVASAARAVEPRTTFYHAGLEPEDRTRAQHEFMTGEARVAVATIAFGMGIDKRDIRFVLHYHYPGSVEEYYQEIGRAGRDSLPSQCALLYAPADHHLREFFIDLDYPTYKQVECVYETLWSIDENPVLLTYKAIAEICAEDIKDGQVGAAVRLLDGAGVTQALSGDATARVTIDKPGAAILAEVRGHTQRRVFEALASIVDLETPGEFRVELARLAAGAGLEEDQVRRALGSLASARHIDYEPPFRGRGVQKIASPPPPFGQVKIDWQRQAFLRGLEEEKLAGIESYIHSGGCRRRFILRYFGEKSDLACGTCDNCGPHARARPRQPVAAPPVPATRKDRERKQEPDMRPHAKGNVLEDRPDIAVPVLIAIKELPFPLGAALVARLVTGSKDKRIREWRIDKNPAYGSVSAKKDVVKAVIDDLVDEGYLKTKSDRKGPYARPVLILTPRGEAAAEAAQLEEPQGEGGMPTPPSRGNASAEQAHAHGKGAVGMPPALPAAPPPTPSSELDRLLGGMLVAERDEAQRLVEHLRMYHPREVSVRLEARFAASTDVREQSRAAWAAGELCGREGLEFLIRCARSETVNVRRIAASAIGKVARLVHAESKGHRDRFAQARQALQALAGDAAPQVVQYAKKALAEFPGPE